MDYLVNSPKDWDKVRNELFDRSVPSSSWTKDWSDLRADVWALSDTVSTWEYYLALSFRRASTKVKAKRIKLAKEYKDHVNRLVDEYSKRQTMLLLMG